MAAKKTTEERVMERLKAMLAKEKEKAPPLSHGEKHAKAQAAEESAISLEKSVQSAPPISPQGNQQALLQAKEQQRPKNAKLLRMHPDSSGAALPVYGSFY